MTDCQQKKLSIRSWYYIDHGQTGNTKMARLQNTPNETMYKYNRLPVIYDVAQR